MAEKTGIGWTDHTFNIAWGCFKVSPGCAHCYADTLSRRYGHDVWGPAKTTARRTFGEKHWAEPLKWNAKAESDGVRRRVFCSSMCDVFEEHPTIDAEREKLWPLIRATPWLDWQLLTKRPERIAANLPDDWRDGYANVWLGTSVESQEYADERIPHLLHVPARVRFLSCEPLLGPVSISAFAMSQEERDRRRNAAYWAFTRQANAKPPQLADPQAYLPPLHWVIVGGESGAGARPMETTWASNLRDECAQYGIAYYLKQLGGHPDARAHAKALLDGRTYTEFPVHRLPSLGTSAGVECVVPPVGGTPS